MSSTQVADITRRQAAAPGRDEIELIAEALKLAPDQAQRLRRRVVAQRAARTFSIERGEFVLDDRITISVVPGSELDIRAIVYLGARQNLSETRLEAELAQFGSWFRLNAEASSDLPHFGFSEAEGPTPRAVADRGRARRADRARSRAAGRACRAVRAGACNACETKSLPSTIPPPLPRAKTSRASTEPPTVSRTKSLDPQTTLRRRATHAGFHRSAGVPTPRRPRPTSTPS